MRWVGTRWLLVMVLGLVASCGGTTAPATTAPPAGGVSTTTVGGSGQAGAFFSSGSALRGVLAIGCDDWGLVEEPYPGEHDLTCTRGGEFGLFVVLVPDPDGYYRSRPEAIAGSLTYWREQPQEWCEHFGGMTLIAGINWWGFGVADLVDAAAELTGAFVIPGIDCSPFEPEPSPPTTAPAIASVEIETLAQGILAGVGNDGTVYYSAPDPAAAAIGCEGAPVDVLWGVDPADGAARQVRVDGAAVEAQQLVVHPVSGILAIEHCEESVVGLTFYDDYGDATFANPRDVQLSAMDGLRFVQWATEGGRVLLGDASRWSDGTVDVYAVDPGDGATRLLFSGRVADAAQEAGDRLVWADPQGVAVGDDAGSVIRRYGGSSFALAPNGIDLAVADGGVLLTGTLGGDLGEIASFGDAAILDLVWVGYQPAVAVLVADGDAYPRLVVATASGDVVEVAPGVLGGSVVPAGRAFDLAFTAPSAEGPQVQYARLITE